MSIRIPHPQKTLAVERQARSPGAFACLVAPLSIAAPQNARRKPREDDDEDEEEEKPKKKAKTAKPLKKKVEDDDKEEEKPRPKKAARRRDDNDDDDDDGDDDDDSGGDAEEEPIKWTKRKRQLQVTNNALGINLVAFWILLAFFALDVIVMLLLLVAFFVPEIESIARPLTYFVVLPVGGAAFMCLCVAWVMYLFAPAKAELRVTAVAGLGFFITPVLLYLIYFTLRALDFFRSELVDQRFNQLMLLGAAISVFISFFCGLTVIQNIALFMKQQKLSNQPVTLGWFIIGGTIARIGTIVLLVALAASEIRIPFLGLGLLGASMGAYFFVLRSNYELIVVIQKLRACINEYIRLG